jgi:hypothetical protein
MTVEESKLDSQQDQFLPSRVPTGSRAHQSLIQLTLAVVYPGIRQPERPANHSPKFGAEVKNEWSYNSNSRTSC